MKNQSKTDWAFAAECRRQSSIVLNDPTDADDLLAVGEIADWFREQVAEGIREADDPKTVMVPHEEVVKDMHRQREAIKAKIARST